MKTNSPLISPEELDPTSLLAPLSVMGDVYFFMKDTLGRFIGGNELLYEKLGVESEDDLLGKTDLDFFPGYMIAHYAKDDAQVIRTGEPILRRVELVANVDGSVSWHVTSKFPLHNQKGRCVGIVGYMRDLERSHDAWQPYRRMAKVVDYVNQHYAQPITVEDLAKVASLSVSQFERRFRAVFQTTPSRFLITYRLTRASHRLMQSEDTLSNIAQDVGFFDHSHFSREFKKLFGLSPGRYRKENATPP